MPGTAYVDDVNAPTKAICRFEMSWTYISDDADLPWIEEVLGQLVKTTWMQVIWVPERKGNYPLKDISKTFTRLEEYRNRGFAYALCFRTIQELEKKGMKPIWACNKDNVESDRLAQRLGYVNPLEYEFVYLESHD